MHTHSSETHLFSADAARRLLLAGCALDRAPALASEALVSVLVIALVIALVIVLVIELVRALGFVQVDGINLVERAQRPILHPRFDGDEPAQSVHRIESPCHAFEHGTHDTSVIRSDWLPGWTHRCERIRAPLRQSARMREQLGRNR